MLKPKPVWNRSNMPLASSKILSIYQATIDILSLFPVQQSKLNGMMYKFMETNRIDGVPTAETTAGDQDISTNFKLPPSKD